MKTMRNLMPVMMALFLAAGCGKDAENIAPATEPAAVPAALAAVFAEVTSEKALSAIPDLRRAAGPGDEVVLEAKVMGTREPFVDGRAVFVVGDEGTLTSCDMLHGDGCATPWDNCCDDPKALRAGTATIQLVDAEGKVLRHRIKGVFGLKELSRLRIAGVVAPNSTEDAFLVNATHIQVL